jgi:hypothetical protein
MNLQLDSGAVLRQFGFVAKPVIGRKLDALMDKPKSGGAASPFSSPETKPAEKPAEGGVNSLLRGQAPGLKPRAARIPRWYFFGADLLLVALALVVMYKSPVPLSGLERFFGVAAVVVGAFLAVTATCMKCGKDS